MPDYKTMELRDVVTAFRDRYPNLKIDNLNGMKMRGILSGEIILVKVSGKNTYEMWKKSDIESGKLDERNARIREINRRIRQRNREQEAIFWKEMQDMMGTDAANLFRELTK